MNDDLFCFFIGKCWMDVLDFVFRCISLLVRFMKKDVEIVYVVLDLF